MSEHDFAQPQNRGPALPDLQTPANLQHASDQRQIHNKLPCRGPSVRALNGLDGIPSIIICSRQLVNQIGHFQGAEHRFEIIKVQKCL
jgi:hypothetical protein